MAKAMKYFSTKYAVRMMGARFIPSVCYKLDEAIAPAVAKLAESGEARMYPEKVRFVNGVALPSGKAEKRVENSLELDAHAGRGALPVTNTGKGSGTSKRGGKKDFD